MEKKTPTCSERLQIPSINFNNLDPNQPNGSNWEDIRIQVITALETYGCFDAIYNKVGSDMKEVLFRSILPEIFELPLEKKKRIVGYDFGKVITEREYESVRVQDTDNPLSVDRFVHMFCPEGNQLFCYAQYVRSIEQIVERMIFQSFGIEKQFDSHIESLVYGVRFAKYGDSPTKETRVLLPTHRDPTLITIVCQNEIEGLEVLTKEEEWIHVVPLPSSFTVMIGEPMMVLTNGRLGAPLHRVSVDQRRYSILMASRPKEGYLIEVSKELIDENHPLKYPPPFDYFKYLEFLMTPEGHQAKDSLKAFYAVLEE